jgi:hypothetical protein
VTPTRVSGVGRLPTCALLTVRRAHRTALAAVAVTCAVGVSACGNTLQDQPVAPSILEPAVRQEQFPVYWLGGTFQGLRITRVALDPSGAWEVQYGNCTVGGENTCVTPLEVVTSPDNSFLPGGEAPRREVPVRGVRAVATRGGRTLTVATGGVVVDVYANSPRLARAAAAAVVTIGTPNTPGTPLPKPLPNTGYGEKPLPSQQPTAAPMGWAEVLSAHVKQ